MKIYSADLRQRVVAAVQAGELSQAAIAKAFSVSLGTVENWWRSFRTTGRTAALPHAGGTKRKLQPHSALLHRLVQQQPDVTLPELCARLVAQTGVQTTPSMMCRELQHLHLPRKKVPARQSARHATRPGAAPDLSRTGAPATAVLRRPVKVHR